MDDDELDAEAGGEARAKLAELQEQRARAAARVDDVEREARQAGAAVQQCLAELSEAERSGAEPRHAVGLTRRRL